MSGTSGKPGPAAPETPDLTPEALQSVRWAFRRRRARALGKLRTCKGCNKEFRAPRTDSRHCSSGCRVRAFRKRRGLSQAQPPFSPGARHCPHCNRGFTPVRRSGKYCGPACRLASFRAKKREACNRCESNELEQLAKYEAADSSEESTAESRLRGNLPSRTSETS